MSTRERFAFEACAVPDRSRWVLTDLLRERALEHPDRPYLSFGLGTRDLTYGELDLESDRVAAGLAALGVEPGSSVLLQLRNRAEIVLGWLGANKLGARQVPVNVDYVGHLLEHVANTAGARVAIVEEDLCDVIAASLPRLRHLETLVVVGATAPALPGIRTLTFDELASAEGSPPVVQVRPGDAAGIYFTSGTSGPSKGALIPHAHVHLLAETNGLLLELDADSVVYTELPLFHINSQMNMYTALLYGAQIRIEPRFSAGAWLERIRASGATHTALLGVMLAFLLKQPERPDDADNPMRKVWSVPRASEIALAFQERFGIEELLTSFGNTEAGMVVAGSADSPPAAAGRVVDAFYELKIVDPETDEELPTGEVGEAVVRPRFPGCVTLGYIGMPERTAEAFRNLWFHTGDAGYFDADGYFYFFDRIKDRIRRRGENIASADIEFVLDEHPAVAEAAVIAVKSEITGGEDEIKACVVLRPEAACTEDDLWAWCGERLPQFAVPRYIELVAELPKTPTEKVRKNVLREQGVTPGTRDRGAEARGASRR